MTYEGIWTDEAECYRDRKRNLALLATCPNPETTDPLKELSYLSSMRYLIEKLEGMEVTRARAQGATWAAIALELGITRQAAQKRFGGRQSPPERDEQSDQGGHDQEKESDWDVAPPVAHGVHSHVCDVCTP